MESIHRYLCRFDMVGSYERERGGGATRQSINTLQSLLSVIWKLNTPSEESCRSQDKSLTAYALSSTSCKGKNRMAFTETAGVSSRMPLILLTYVSNEV